MIIKSLELENIRTYSRQKINFSKGSLLLSGDIGSGKTTLLLAIEFALFGLRRKSLEGNSLLSYGKKEGCVILNFQIDNKDVVIKRNLKRTKSDIKQTSGYIVINNIKKEMTAIELKTKILELLGYPSDLVTKTKNLIYRYTVYTPQEEMKQILFDDGRIDTLRKVFGIDKYKRIRENTVFITRKIKENKNLLSVKLEGFEEKKKKLEEKEKENLELLKSLGNIKKEIFSVESKIKEADHNIKKLEKEIKDLDELKHESSLLDERLSSRVKQNSEIKNEIETNKKEVEELKKKIESINIKEIDIKDIELEKDIEEKENFLRKLIDDQSRFEEKIKTLSEEIAILLKDIKKIDDISKDLEKISLRKKEFLLKVSIKQDVEKKRDDIIKDIESIDKDIYLLEEKILSSKKIIDGIEKIKECPTCLQNVSLEHKNSIKEKEINIIKRNKSKSNLLSKDKKQKKEIFESINKDLEVIYSHEKNIQEINTKLESFKLYIKDLKDKRNRLNTLISQKEDLEKKLTDIKKYDKKEINKEIVKSKNILKQLRENKLKLKDKENFELSLKAAVKRGDILVKELSDIKNQIGNINKEKIKISSLIKDKSHILKEYDREKKTIVEFYDKNKILVGKASYMKKEIETLEDIIKELKNSIEEMSNYKKKFNYFNELHAWIDEYFMNLMSDMEKHVFFTVFHEFNSLFQEWFNILVEDETMSVRLDDMFSPIITHNGHDATIENLSGGEKTSVALAYRLALNKIINDMMSEIKTKDILILDEPTDGFSSEQLDKVRDVLLLLGVSQIIMVSHETKIESFVDNVLKIVKSEGKSAVVE